MKALRKLFAVIKKEFRQLRRDRITFFMIVGVPIGQILLFGYAINTDVRNLKSAVADQADSHLSRQFIAELGQTQVLDLTFTVETPQQLEELLRMG
ncbi:MAG TPA: ABC transporter permease, partial [Woeseiaceae bacterium]